MKHLQSYSLFEGLKERWQDLMDDLERTKEKRLNEMKSEVDDYMHYILDEYQRDSSEDFIGGKESLYIEYNNIFVPFNSLEGEFLPILKDTSEQLQKEFEIKFKIRGKFLFIDNFMDGDAHPLNNWNLSDVEELEKWIKGYHNTQEEVKHKYKLFYTSIFLF